ncbi:hypothetical protein Aph01nite_22290 [Acrocarpospora phusangensis]|uniref:LppX_LprAFG lipoprotein n=1 Tax=Acrocarpospora phusangensis TaxID=1070424 RepID=A0A919Q9Z5_9ACTN|nr:hypothetical protein [Acrocarpospora phusangensis]GIH23919.1 hypothetical protein Aph01nite_22290 [Acrocarpospora phusangensis]
MRRFIAYVGTALVVLIAGCGGSADPSADPTASPTVNPLAALEAQFVAKRGVKVSEIQETHVDGELFNNGNRDGVVQFSGIGVDGYDITMKTELMDAPIRTLAIGSSSYQSGGTIADVLPDGKKWRKSESEPGKRTPFFTPMLILEPATLKAVLATMAKQSGGVYEGTITLGALHAVSPSFQAEDLTDTREAALVMSWRMSVGLDGLPTRLVTSYSDPEYTLGPLEKKSDIRFSSWGTPVELASPPEKETST